MFQWDSWFPNSANSAVFNNPIVWFFGLIFVWLIFTLRVRFTTVWLFYIKSTQSLCSFAFCFEIDMHIIYTAQKHGLKYTKHANEFLIFLLCIFTINLKLHFKGISWRQMPIRKKWINFKKNIQIKFQFDSTSSSKLICLPKLFVVIINTAKTNVICFHMSRSH